MTADQTMSDEDLKPPPRRLPVWAILVGAVLLSWRRRSHFGRLLVIPVAVTTLIFYLIGRAIPLELAERAAPLVAPSADFVLIMLLGGLLYGLTFIFFAVSCHRSILLGDHAVARYGFAGWTGREMRFLLRMVQVGLLAALVYFPFLLVTGWIVSMLGSFAIPVMLFVLVVVPLILWLPAYAYLLGRFSLVLPATAVDLSPTLASAWSQSLGNGWRLAIVIGGPVFAISALNGLITALISMVVPTSMGVFGEIGSYLFISLAYYISFTVVVAGLSISFWELSGWGQRRVA